MTNDEENRKLTENSDVGNNTWHSNANNCKNDDGRDDNGDEGDTDTPPPKENDPLHPKKLVNSNNEVNA